MISSLVRSFFCFPIQGTRLYYDRFNFSVNPLLRNDDRAILTGHRSKHRKTVLAAGVILALAGAGFYAMSQGKGFEWPVFAATVSRLDWGWLGLALAASYGTYVVRALRWTVLIEPLVPHPRVGRLLSATIIGFSAVTASPAP